MFMHPDFLLGAAQAHKQDPHTGTIDRLNDSLILLGGQVAEWGAVSISDVDARFFCGQPLEAFPAPRARCRRSQSVRPMHPGPLASGPARRPVPARGHPYSAESIPEACRQVRQGQHHSK